MELLAVQHPDIFRFVTMKEDRSKVTGANISVKFTDKFLKAVEADEDFLCTFPVDIDSSTINVIIKNWNLEYNKLYPVNFSGLHERTYGRTGYIMQIRAKELFEEFVNMAHSNAEPGAAYIDRIVDYSPDGVYEAYIPNVCNPCGEQWFHEYDTCRLIAENFFNMVKNQFEKNAEIDYELLI
jgi:ribonucleoside-diphosphate reductase alpha chain